MDTIIQTFNLTNYQDEGVDWPALGKTGTLFVGHSFERIIGVQAVYLLFVLVIGPTIMQNRKPFDLRWFMRAYNLLNMLFNLYIVRMQLHNSNNLADYFSCDSIRRAPEVFARSCDLLIISRVADLMDTIVFVLRKKDKQVTFLHIYHHTVVPLSIFIGAYMSMTIYSSVILTINSCVHIIMYGYYFLASFPSMAPHLWWKRHITKIQIGQFIILFLYLTISYPLINSHCSQSFPLPTYLVNLGSTLVFLFLFITYYIETYRQKIKRQSLLKEESSKGAAPPAASRNKNKLA